MDSVNSIGMLEEVIQAEIKRLPTLTPGSAAKASAIDELSKLYKLKIEEMGHISDYACKKEQISEQVKDRYFKLGIAATELIIPLIFYGVWMRRGFKFEETGTFTSTTFKGLFSRFKPTKK